MPRWATLFTMFTMVQTYLKDHKADGVLAHSLCPACVEEQAEDQK